MKKSVLGLILPTDPRWINIAQKNMADILIDHAYCEQKAASSCISLIVQYPEEKELVDTLTPIVAEEWEHFTLVLQEMDQRGIRLAPCRKDEYVVQLQKILCKEGSRIDRLADKLLLNALIEARSCERFKLLWKGIDDRRLSAFYHRLMISEAGHYKIFIRLAERYKEHRWVQSRWTQWLSEEAKIMSNMEVRADRMH